MRTTGTARRGRRPLRSPSPPEESSCRSAGESGSTRACLEVDATRFLKRPDNLVLGPVVLEKPLHLFPLRHRDQKRQKQDHPNRAVGHVEGNQVLENGIMTLQDRCQVQWQKLVEQNKERQRERQVQR